MERRLAAILFADVVGYSRLMEVDEAGTHDALMACRRELIDPAAAAHNGRIVKSTGDGVLAEFASVVDAVRCAVELQEQMNARNADVPKDRRIDLRMGINLGDIIAEDDDIYGDGVNVAARLEGLAEPGGICLSADTYRQVRGRINVEVEDLGERELKNMAQPIRVYRIASDSFPTAFVEPAKVLSGHSDKPSVAVLPFTNVSGDPEQEYFSDGITEDIITELSRFREFAIVARNSTFHYKGHTPKAKDVGRDLGVKFVVQGSVRRAADRVRVTAQLIDSETEHHIWADRYDRELAGIFEIQDEIAEAVVARVADSVKMAVTAHSRSRQLHSATAYDLVLQSRPYRTSIARSDSEEAAKLLLQAMTLDPGFSLAYSSLAFVRGGEYVEGWAAKPDATLREALAMAKRAVALDNSDGYAHASLAYAHYLSRNFDRAVHEARTALSLNPNHVNIVMTAGWICVAAGDPEAGIKHIQRARRLNPYLGGFEIWTLGEAYFVAKRYEEALDAFSQVTNPPTGFHLELAAIYAYLGRVSEARDSLQTYLDLAKWELDPFPGDDQEAWREFLRQSYRFRRKEDFEHLVEGMRKAGLPA